VYLLPTNVPVIPSLGTALIVHLDVTSTPPSNTPTVVSAPL